VAEIAIGRFREIGAQRFGERDRVRIEGLVHGATPEAGLA
jgi:hypothetical protein